MDILRYWDTEASLRLREEWEQSGLRGRDLEACSVVGCECWTAACASRTGPRGVLCCRLREEWEQSGIRGRDLEACSVVGCECTN
jgi:hypothetical protein